MVSMTDFQSVDSGSIPGVCIFYSLSYKNILIWLK